MKTKLFPAVPRVPEGVCRRCGRPPERCRCARWAKLAALGVVLVALGYGWAVFLGLLFRWVG